MTDVAPSSHLDRELATQPENWRQVLDRLPNLGGVLPADGERVAVVGCGTSYHVALAYAAAREAAGRGITDAWPASEYRDRGEDRVLLISRSGTTSEVAALQQRLIALGRRAPVVVATAGTPIAVAAGSDAVLLPEVDERSVVQTRFATTVLALLRGSLGHEVEAAASQARAVLDEPVDTALPAALLDADQVTFLGHGWAYGVVLEAALKLRESTQAWTEAYQGMEYRHGPISIAAPGRAVWAFGELPEGLAAQIAATGAHLEHRDADPLAELVRVHRLCAELTRRRGLDPDAPRNLTRSVVLDGASQ